MEIFLTILSGTFVFVIGQTIQNFILLPIQRHKEVIGKINNKLKFYDFVISNHISLIKEELVLEARRELRHLSCDLESTYKEIPFRNTLLFVFNFFDLRKVDEISDSASRLMGLSNISESETESEFHRRHQDTDKIRKILHICALDFKS